MRQLLAAGVACGVLGLAACAGAPKKGAPPADAARPVASSEKPPRRSPYPPAREDPRKRGNYTAGGLYAPDVDDAAPEGPVDVSLIPEPEVVAEPLSRYGNRPTYSVLGRKYHVLDSAEGYVAEGMASYYGTKFHGRRTSNMEVYDMYAFTAAHKTLPLPSFARVTNLDNGRSVVVRVNDRGPFHEGRIIDLSYAAAVKLGIVQAGTGRVEVRALMPGDEAEAPIYAGGSDRGPQPEPPSGMDQLVAALPVDSAKAVELPPGVRIATGQPARIPPAAGVQDPAAGGTSTSAVASGSYAGAGEVILQVAAFSARDNADRALARLRDAGIGPAHVLDGQAGGEPVWRLRVGPLEAAIADDLSARISGLGFGPPQQVRE